jgi:bifunctional non-homologous end joining protein LigD
MAPKDKLSEYRSKRDFEATPEPPPGETAANGAPRFVVQEHSARNLHWDLRLEHGGTLVSWALPKGIPTNPKKNLLAVHVEDHPLSYIDFAGEIPAGNYGAGTVKIWDEGTYEPHKFRSDEVIVTLHGDRVEGKYALFQTRGKNWMIHRMDPPADPAEAPMPEHVKPMLARLSSLPPDDSQWGFEIKWDGVRALFYSEAGHVSIESRNLRDVTAQYPELRPLGRALGSHRVVLDGEIVALDERGLPNFGRLQPRMHLVSPAAIKRRMADTPVVYMVFDVLYLDGHVTMPLPYEQRRELLDRLGLDGPNWKVPAYHRGDGPAMVAASKAQNLEGVIAKRLDCPYVPGGRTGTWLKVKNHLRQEFVIGGWLPGQGTRTSSIGSLALGYYEGGQLRYAGNVGTGFTAESLAELKRLLDPLRTADSPFADRQPPKGAVFVEPKLVAEVEFGEWTRTKTVRHPSFKGIRDDKDPRDVILEEPEA